MVAIPSGIRIPTPTAVGRLVERSWVWTGTGRLLDRPVDCSWVGVGTEKPVEVLTEADAETVVALELGLAKKAVVTAFLGLLVEADVEGVTGGYPKIE